LGDEKLKCIKKRFMRKLIGSLGNLMREKSREFFKEKSLKFIPPKKKLN
jgi:hypothetical protein